MKKLEDFFRPYLTKVLISLFPKREQVSTQDIINSDIKRVLIVYPHNEIGDMILSTPLFRAIKESIKENCLVDLIARPLHSQVLKNNLHIDNIHIFDKKRLGIFGFIKFISQIRSKKYDLALVINSVSFSLTSCLLAYFSDSKYVVSERKLTLEFSKYIKNLYNLLLDIDLSKHDSERKLDYGRAFGWDTNEKAPIIELDKLETQFYYKVFDDNKINKNDIVLCMHIGAGKFQNRWPCENFVELGKHLQEKYNVKILIAWGPKEIELKEQAQSLAGDEFIFLPPTTLRELASILKQTDLCILNDTGVLHVAAGVRATTLALFGPTYVNTWNPLSKENYSIQARDNDINSITVEEVKNKVDEILLKNLKYVDNSDI